MEEQKQNKYKSTVMYKIYCKDANIKDFYIGHTTNFTNRKRQHKENCNHENYRDYNMRVYQFIRENGNWNNWIVEQIEEYECDSKVDAEKREKHYIETLKPTLNKCIPTRTDKEYYTDNIEKILEQRKQYGAKNKEIILEKKK